MKALSLLLLLSAFSALASSSLEKTAKEFGAIIFSDNNQVINVNEKYVDVYSNSEITNEIQTVHISYTDASDHYYATIEMIKNDKNKYEVINCATPDYVVQWKNGQACRDVGL